MYLKKLIYNIFVTIFKLAIVTLSVKSSIFIISYKIYGYSINSYKFIFIRKQSLSFLN